MSKPQKNQTTKLFAFLIIGLVGHGHHVQSTEVNLTTREYSTEGDVRLLHGAMLSEGLVEVYWQSRWQVVCGDHWRLTAASVVCRQLGYPTASDAVVQSRDGESDILFKEVMCTGDESCLIECDITFFKPDYSRDKIAGVVCATGATTLPPTTVFTDIPTTIANATNRWRADYRCGGEFLAPNGEIAECDPEGTSPCCSPNNWCDLTASHCECEGCIDYRVTDQLLPVSNLKVYLIGFLVIAFICTVGGMYTMLRCKKKKGEISISTA